MQIFLESTGRVFKLAPNSWLDESQGEPGVDLIYVAGYRAADVMTTDPVTLPESAMLADAENLMREKHIKHVVILDASNRPCGIVEFFQ